MSLRTRIDPIDRDIALMLSEDLSPAAQSRVLADFAREQIEEAKQINRTVLGRVPPYTVAVDGREGASLETVKPDGVILAEFELVSDLLVWIGDQLIRHSPVKTGRYQKSHSIFADGVEIDLGHQIPVAQQYVFISGLPYARKIERGQSSKAPDGVYQVAASLAQRRFGNIARVSFAYRTALTGVLVGGRRGDRAKERNPAIIVTMPRM